MGKPWAYMGDDGKLHLTPEEAELVRIHRERARKSWNEYLKKTNEEKKRRKNEST